MLYMKRRNCTILWKKVLFLVSAAFLAAFFIACNAMPSPLYGTFADNAGNTFSFFDDGTFMARVKVNGITENSEGNYSVLRNVMTLSLNDGQRIVTEWDLRGNVLYLDWRDETGKPVGLSLLKISN